MEREEETMKIYIVRHGETDWNVQNRLQGQTDILLNEKGIREAERTAEKLKDIPFEAVYASPLRRAVQTAQILKGERNIPLQTDQRLIEMSFGVYEGLSSINEDYLIPDKDFFYKFQKRPSLYIPPEGGETFEEVCARTTGFLRELAAKEEYRDSSILVVAHGASIRGLLSSLWMKGDIDRFWGSGPQKNCSVTLLQAENGAITLEAEGIVY